MNFYYSVREIFECELNLSKKLDEVDLKIIQLLKNDARSSITNLADAAGISRPTAMKRLERLLEQETIGIETGINLKEMGFRIGCVGLEVEGAVARRDVFKILQECPRVLMILCPFEKVTFSVYLYAEDDETLRSVIYGFAEFPNTSVSYFNYSDPPLYPKTFPIKLSGKKNDIAPCGKNCEECFSFRERICVGCPAVSGNKGLL